MMTRTMEPTRVERALARGWLVRLLVDRADVLDAFEAAQGLDESDRLSRWTRLRNGLELPWAWLDDELDTAWAWWQVRVRGIEDPLFERFRRVAAARLRIHLADPADPDPGPAPARRVLSPEGEQRIRAAISARHEGDIPPHVAAAMEERIAQLRPAHWYDPVLDLSVEIAERSGARLTADIALPGVRLLAGISVESAYLELDEHMAMLRAMVRIQASAPGGSDPSLTPARRQQIIEDVDIFYRVTIVDPEHGVSGVADELYGVVGRDNRKTVRAARDRAKRLLSDGVQPASD